MGAVHRARRMHSEHLMFRERTARPKKGKHESKGPKMERPAAGSR